jgi:hypothetical protein
MCFPDERNLTPLSGSFLRELKWFQVIIGALKPQGLIFRDTRGFADT